MARCFRRSISSKSAWGIVKLSRTNLSLAFGGLPVGAADALTGEVTGALAVSAGLLTRGFAFDAGAVFFVALAAACAVTLGAVEALAFFVDGAATTGAGVATVSDVWMDSLMFMILK